MKLTLLLTAALFAATFAAEARGGSRGSYSSSGSRSSYSSGSTRSGYVHRNPYAAHPSVRVRDYTRSSGTYVERHVRTPANDTLKDNLSYRGYGTVRVPRD